MASFSINNATHAPEVRYGVNACAQCGAGKCSDGKPLNRCGRCRLQQYCSRDCQQKNWPQHKTVCKGMIWKLVNESKDLLVGYSVSKQENLKGAAIMVTPVKTTETSNGYAYHLMPGFDIPAEMLQAAGWARLPLPAALGFPIRTVGTHADDGTSNELIEAVCWQNDIKSARFGYSCVHPKPTGGMAVVREDGGTIHVKHLVALVQYARVVMAEIEEMGIKGKGNMAKKKELGTKRLNRKAFKNFFDELKEAGMVEEPKGWEGVECPVQGV